jgi:hypothetical protein
MPSETLTRAIERARSLPEADQERVGRELDAFIDDLGKLRGELGAGLQSLDAGLGRELDMEAVIARARAACHGGE